MTEQLNPSSVNKFLQANPTFLRQWILTNISPEVLNIWLEDLKTGSSKRLSEPSSAQGGALRSGDCHVDFITEGIFNEIVVGRRSSLPPSRQNLDVRRPDLAKMDDKALFMQLVRDIADELDVNILCYKILWSVCFLTKSERASLFLVKGTKDEKYLVSKLFDVCETSSIYETLHADDNTIKVPFGKGIAGLVALKKEAINIKDAYQVHQRQIRSLPSAATTARRIRRSISLFLPLFLSFSFSLRLSLCHSLSHEPFRRSFRRP